MKNDLLQHDCLNYHVYHEIPAYQELLHAVDEVIPYCFRPVNHLERSLKTFVNPLSRELNFKELRLDGISSLQLLSWSISIDVTQRYQSYLNEPNASANEHFYNCTEPWFGTRCQYSFGSDGRRSFNQIVEAAFHGRESYSESSEVVTQVPCYVLLECHRQGKSWCLDWREVCNEIVDCFDEGVDEEYCFDMEINECQDDEYRCHNGLCISSELWEEGEGDADCLDRSDEKSGASYINSCFQDPTVRCEEHSCRLLDSTFPCGDGQCVDKFDECHNGRHLLLIESMTSKGNLTDECWIVMVCLTQLVKEANGISCEIWLMDNSTSELMEQCDPFFQFPTVPVHSNHIRFFFDKSDLRNSTNKFPLPNYLCYDQQLCHFIKPDLVRENMTCLNASESMLAIDLPVDSWSEMLSMIEHDFRPCLISQPKYHNKTQKYIDYSILYNCKNSQKFISKHRIMDREQDCFQADDENSSYSCQLNHRYRVTCGDADICWSPISKSVACLSFSEYIEIPFQRFCDGISEYTYNDSTGKEYNDEEGCESWTCDNIYARCDGYWACIDGRDEANCSPTKCHSGTQACVDRLNYTVVCLSYEHVNNNITDCLGASDEQHHCRTIYPPTESSLRFRCSDHDECLSSSRLCDDIQDCPFADDETTFCNNHQFTCKNNLARSRTEIEEVLCGLSEQDNRRVQYFSVQTTSNLPRLEKSVVDEASYWLTEPSSIVNVDGSPIEHISWPWYCNRGLAGRALVENDSFDDVCICPPSYYGHLCQYQNQRVSLTVRLTSVDRYAVYAIIIMLIDHNDKRQQIDVHDQFVYIAKNSCSIKLNRYLLFATRPKNISRNYSVRIDAFEKDGLTCIGSWYFPISFLFLPVNRLAVSLILPDGSDHSSSNCLPACRNGTCVKYLNQEMYFCRCHSGWAGAQCDIPLNRRLCSDDSFCFGSANNQSICVCPLHKFGPQCLLTSTCPPNACKNRGQCVPADVSASDSSYTCVCADQYFGSNCEYLKTRFNISLVGFDIPPYVVAYVFTLSNQSEPINSIKIQKLTLFQNTVTFYISMAFHIVVIQVGDKYYLAVLQQTPQTAISTSLRSSRECASTDQLLNSTVLKMVQHRRIVFFHYLCQTRFDLICFIDKAYLCLCTNDHHANCLEFKRGRNFQCSLEKYCKNGAHCVQDHPTCPSRRICICPACFFGDECQFYAKGLGSTLDEILGYEFERNSPLSKQPITVKVSIALTSIIFIIGLTNGILSIIIFQRKKCREVGCGTYLLASSITSLTTMLLFTLKFFILLFSSQIDFEQDNLQTILLINCRIIEPLLKVSLYTDNWLNACIALERIVSVNQGINFDKKKSKLVARWIVALVCIVNIGIYIPQMIVLHVLIDKIEERTWCVVTYSSFIGVYSSTLIIVHYFSPLIINILSATCIIILTARQRTATNATQTFYFHLRSKLKYYKHLLISPIIITILTLPHLIISLILQCNKSSHLLWFYLLGYFLSYIPSACIFFIFVLPSPLYMEEFRQLTSSSSRRRHMHR